MFELLDTVPPSVVVLVNVVLMGVAWRAGYVLTRPGPSEWAAVRTSHSTGLARGCLGLLTLLQAFSFGVVYSKHESRRVETVLEANAIGTFASRVELMPEPQRLAIRRDLREYVRLHRQAVDPSLTRDTRMSVDRELRAIQDRMVSEVTGYLSTPEGMPRTVALMPAANAMVDHYELRLAGILAHMPAAVWGLIVVASFVCAITFGRSERLAGAPQPLETLVYVLLVNAVLYATLDLDRPWTGFSRVSDLPMLRLEQSLNVP